MTTAVSDYIDVGKKMADLGCRHPERMALLPINFESATSIDQLLQASETATIKKLLLAQAIPLDDIVAPSQRPPYVKNKSHGWVAPILFISASIYSQNQMLISVALNVLGNYATDFFRGDHGTHNVKLNVVIEKKNRAYKKIAYDGPVEGLKELPKIIREATDE
ncbi:MAG TPA: hypothetical protein VI636_09645 [Candidatus Angelobacter sp.]